MRSIFILGGILDFIDAIGDEVSNLIRKIIFEFDFSLLMQPLPILNLSIVQIAAVSMILMIAKRGIPMIADTPAIFLKATLYGVARGIPKIIWWCVRRIFFAVFVFIKYLLGVVLRLSPLDALDALRNFRARVKQFLSRKNQTP